MQRSSSILILFTVLSATAQDKPQFTARELFYSAATAPAAKPAPPAPKPATQAPAVASAPKKSAPAPKKAPTPPPTQSAAVEPPHQQPTGQHTVPVALPGGVQVMNAAYTQPATAAAPASGSALGLKYTILKKSGDDMVEVAPDTVFHVGDKVQISVQTNGPGYLYIVMQGSSGTWKPIFPSPEVADGNNHVDGWSAKVLPPQTRLVFDEQTGTEKVFIVFSRNPEDGLENMIYSLQGTKARPAADRETRPAPKQIVQTAQVNISDTMVGRLRDTYTRDLIIEKVDEKTPGEKKENAVYVVNPSGSSDSRVVADVKLVHQ
jgi:hypothetical protein